MRLSGPEIAARLTGARSATLGTVAEAGRPHRVPIVFAHQDGTLYTAVDGKPKTTRRLCRIRNIEANPRVSVLVDHYTDDWDRLWWIRLDGAARIAEGGAMLDLAVGILADKYPVYARTPPAGPAVIITVDTVRSWSARGSTHPDG